MEGIINWNELWKVMISSSPWMTGTLGERESFWDKRARQFNVNESMMQNRERAEKQIANIREAGFIGAYIVAFYNEQQISLSKAKELTK